MTSIERTKHNGAVRGLMERIESLRFELTNRNWNGVKSGDHYIRLGKAITDAATIIKQMRETLNALQEMEPKNR